MKVDGVDFAKGFVEKFKDEAAFLKEMDRPGYRVAVYEGHEKRTDKLKEVYQMHHPAKEVKQ
jgi:hypothetical protein